MKKTQKLINKSLNYFYSKLIKDYVTAEFDNETEEYKWAMEKADWIGDSEKYPDELLSNTDREVILKFKKIR